MTAFEHAARAEAERYHADPGVDPLTLSVIDHAMHLAVWARAHLAEQEATDAEVEAVAVAICLGEGAGDLHSWGPATQARFRETAREALRAAARIRKEQKR